MQESEVFRSPIVRAIDRERASLFLSTKCEVPSWPVLRQDVLKQFDHSVLSQHAREETCTHDLHIALQVSYLYVCVCVCVKREEEKKKKIDHVRAGGTRSMNLQIVDSMYFRRPM